MRNTMENLSTREWIHKMVETIEDEGDLEMVKWLVQPYAARSLNKKYKEEHKHELHMMVDMIDEPYLLEAQHTLGSFVGKSLEDDRKKPRKK